MIQQMCPACGNLAVSSMGVSNRLLIVLEKPTERDEEAGLPFSISKQYITAGQVLRTEFALAGLNVAEFRVTNYLLHSLNSKTSKEQEDNCIKAGWDNVIDESRDKQAILLVGQLAVKAFTGYDVADVNGLQIESAFLQAPIIYSLINPTKIFNAGIGELQFGIREFASRLKAEGLV